MPHDTETETEKETETKVRDIYCEYKRQVGRERERQMHKEKRDT